ncbi:MAG: 50S ribosomal protein L4 [Spirochaetales bacterium]|nr:50S ribosomal protein L4 [Spirochaetales bacterium]
MKAQVFAVDGSQSKKIELSDDIFNGKVSMGSIYYAIRNELANKRLGTAHTKTRSEVQGAHKKMYRQKGTGRARAGTRRSPLRVGGGIVFGPRKRSYKYHIPKKIKQLAMRSILSMKNAENKLRIIEDFGIESGKTKDLVQLLRKHITEMRTVFVLKDDDMMIKRAGSNIPWLRMLTFNRLNAHDLFYCKNLIFHETAIRSLNDMYGRTVTEKKTEKKVGEKTVGKATEKVEKKAETTVEKKTVEKVTEKTEKKAEKTTRKKVVEKVEKAEKKADKKTDKGVQE